MIEKKVYKVSFKGVIFPGFDKDLVIENIHNITRIPKLTISRKFFSGKTVVIRHADSQEYASRLQKTFAQAGIETYINELTEAIPAETIEDAHLALADSPEIQSRDIKPKKSSTSKIIAAFVVIVIISLISQYYYDIDLSGIEESSTNNESSTSKESLTNIEESSTSKESTPAKNSSTVANIESSTVKKASTTDKSTQHKTPQEVIPSFFDIEEINSLIKISDRSEINQLKQFIKLTETQIDYSDFIDQEITTDNNNVVISTKNPLYYFKTSKHSGLLLKTKMKISPALLANFQNIFNMSAEKNHSKTSCLKTLPTIKVISTDNHLLITDIKDEKKLVSFEKKSKQKNLLPDLQKLDILFHQTNAAQSTFSFFINEPLSSHFIALSSGAETFKLSLHNALLNKNIDFFKQINITPDNDELLSSLKTKNLFDLILLISAQYNQSKLSLNGQSSSDFAQEGIIKIKKLYSFNDIEPYKNELDVEMLPQWQSGPFAITTNQFKFDKELTIELLAKGQNIHNIMEYSNSSFLQTHTVLNNDNENIIKDNCTDTALNKHYFRDLDGEQEVYINEDFQSYHTITAKETIHIKPGFSNNDISKVEGEIILKLPKQIKQTRLNRQHNVQFFKFENFSLLLKHLPDLNKLEYTIIGNNDSFITLRTYNYSGDVIGSLSLSKNTYLNNNINTYQQIFSEDIEEIKVFHSNENKIIHYPFSFKPQITLALKNEVINSIPLSKSIPPVLFTLEKLNIEPVINEIKLDNPDWFGKKWPEKNVSQAVNSPFFVALFIQNSTPQKNNIDDSIDAVLNIKSNISPFITQNITAVKLTLISDNKTIIDNFISFSQKELIQDKLQTEPMSPTQIPLYLNTNTVIKLTSQHLLAKMTDKLRGIITLNLPTALKTHSNHYNALGQTIKLDNIFIKAIQQNKHQVQFEIRGNIKNLIQLNLYNNKDELISELFEFVPIDKNKAILTLLYNGHIDTIKMIVSTDSITKKYPFSFSPAN